MSNELIEFVNTIVQPVYVVGGCVRDELLGRPINDYDFTTPRSPEEIEAGIRAIGRKPFVTGQRFGTLGVNFNGGKVEITTFRRKEVYKAGSRHPEVLLGGTLEEDLSRRDFTINAIAKIGDTIADPFDGRMDLERQLIRCVGNPSDRFRDDPLRMLRAARFMSQLSFWAHYETRYAAQCMAHWILDVSRERWTEELDKLLLGPSVTRGLMFLYEQDLLKYILPDLAHQNKDTWRDTVYAVEIAVPNVEARWAALFRNICTPLRIHPNRHNALSVELVERIARQLKWSNDRRKAVVTIMLEGL